MRCGSFTFGVGHGDYTHDRDQWRSGLTIEQIEKEIQRMKARGEL
jgi:hypothetical protein